MEKTNKQRELILHTNIDKMLSQAILWTITDYQNHSNP